MFLADAQIDPYRDAIGSLTTVVFADAKRVTDLIEEESQRSPTGIAEVLPALLGEILAPACASAGLVGTEWYRQLRELAGIRAPYSPQIPVVDVSGKARGLATYAVAAGGKDGGSSVFDRLSGGLQRIVAGSGRESIRANMARDPTPVRWARVARPGCCAFCGMLATRGAVYRSRQSAGGTPTDELVSEGLAGRQTQGSRSFHNHCGCVIVPVFPGQKVALPKDLGAYEEAYTTATRELTRKRDASTKATTVSAVQTNAIVSRMREILAAKDQVLPAN